MEEVIVLKVNGEIFLKLSDKKLDRRMKIELESICECVSDDYAEETNELDTYQLCSWLEDKIASELDIKLSPVGISTELTVSNL